MSNFQIVGQPVRRIDGYEKVTGRIKYGVDMSEQGMLWAQTLRSPHAHARLLSIDTSKAAALPGVEAVVTASDIQGTNRHGIERQDQPVLVPLGERVKMLGDPVAAVAARSKQIAEEALALIDVKYEPLPGVFTMKDALLADAPQLHDDAPGNVISEYSDARGDVERAFAEADVIVEGEFHLPRQEQAYLEVEGGLATIDSQGVITVYAGSQRPVFIRKSIHKSLDIPEHKIRSISAATGGAFGGKADLTMHALAAFLARETGKSIKLVWSREESFMMHPKRHPFLIRARLAAKSDGTFTALEAEMLADSGAYASHSLIVVFAACSYLPGPYDIPHLKTYGRAVYTNNPISGACRGYGQPQAVTALESLIDWLASELNIDPVDIRLKNALEMGDVPGSPRVLLDTPPTLPLTIKEALAAAGALPAPSGSGKKVGRGVACAMPIFDISTKDIEDMRGVGATVEVFPDGTALVRSGISEIGAGLNTVLAQVAAEELGLQMEQVAVMCGNTESTPDAGPTVASRQAYCSGNAVRLAVADVRARIFEVASDILHAEENELEMNKGTVRVQGNGRSIPLHEVTKVCHRTGVNLLGSAWFSGDHAPAGHTFMTAIADVEVDEETGQVHLLKIVNAHDAGKALNPQNVVGQLIGGASFGIGYALYEEMPTHAGELLTPSLTEYLTPMSLDGAEEWQAVIVEDPYPTGPYGAKGVGEHGTNTTPVAILNAIFQATGVRITEMPATSERVLKALKQSRPPGHPIARDRLQAGVR